MSRTIKATFSMSDEALERIRAISMGLNQTIKDTVAQALKQFEHSLDAEKLAQYVARYEQAKRLKNRF